MWVVGEPDRVVVVRLGQPRQESDDEWSVAYLVDGLQGELAYGRGPDALDALINAVAGLRAVMDHSGVRLTWACGEPEGDPGVPRFVPHYLGRAFAARQERVIEEATERFVDELAKRNG